MSERRVSQFVEIRARPGVSAPASSRQHPYGFLRRRPAGSQGWAFLVPAGSLLSWPCCSPKMPPITGSASTIPFCHGSAGDPAVLAAGWALLPSPADADTCWDLPSAQMPASPSLLLSCTGCDGPDSWVGPSPPTPWHLQGRHLGDNHAEVMRPGPGMGSVSLEEEEETPEHARALSTMGGRSKKETIYKPERQLSTGTTIG